jgi:hypothetical protein
MRQINRPQAEMEFDQAAGLGDWPEMDQTSRAARREPGQEN